MDIHAAHGVFPLTQMVETGLWSALSANAKAVLGPLWNYLLLPHPDHQEPTRNPGHSRSGLRSAVVR